MLCAISGIPPKTPVVSPRSGHVFELSLIEQYINEHHKDPINSEPLQLDELIHIKNSETPFQPPRQPTLNSIPALLSSLQNEWDSVALELFSLRKQLEDTRRELSTALYHHDAAVRVAARSIKERDEARKALQDLSISIGSGAAAAGQEQEPTEATVTDSTIPETIVADITRANEELFQIHKAEKKKVNVSITHEFNVDETSIGTKPFKKVIQGTTTSSGFVFTSTTGISAVYNSSSGEVIKDDTIIKDKHISSILISKLSSDKFAGLTNGKVYYNDQLLQTNHKSKIIAILEHPSLSNLFITVDESGLYSIIDTNSKSIIFNDSIPEGAVSADIHLDGALIAISNTKGNIYIIDIRTGQVSTSLTNGEAVVSTLKFGSNGYWLFAAANDSSLSIWDLRKNTSVKITTSSNIHAFALDKSSQLVVGINDTNQLEIIQYNKSKKDWFVKGKYAFASEDDPISAFVADDTQENVLVVDILQSSSGVKKSDIELMLPGI